MHLGAAQEVAISRAQGFMNSDRYEFFAGFIIPGLIAGAAWYFLKRARNTPTAGQARARRRLAVRLRHPAIGVCSPSGWSSWPVPDIEVGRVSGGASPPVEREGNP